MDAEHESARLPALAAGTLPPEEERLVAAHVAGCSACAEELADWRSVRAALRSAPQPRPAPAALEVVRMRVQVQAAPRAQLRFARLLRAELPVVHRRIWAASLLALLLGIPVTLFERTAGGTYLALFAPLVAAAGVALVYGPSADPAYELAQSMPTSPRMVLLARLTLVFGYDLAATLAISGLLAGAGLAPGGFETLILRWLGPMLMLSALSLALSLRFTPYAGIGVALGLWGWLLTVGPSLDQMLGGVPALLLTTDAVTVGTAALIGVLLVTLLPRLQERRA